jgi:hypothetical protein
MHAVEASVPPVSHPFSSSGWFGRHSIPFSAPSAFLSRLLVVIAIIAQVVVAWHFRSLTWDDSAITLGFARSFALTGKIEPTPGSGIVEGYSTTLWMLLMTIAAKLVTTPVALLAAAKLSTLLINIANVVLIRRWFLSWTSEVCANLVAGSVGCGLMFYETINGMETPLLLLLILAMLLLFPRTNRMAIFCYLLAGSAFLLTRWEAAWLLVPFVLIETTFRRAIISSATWLTVFVVSNFVRWRYFGFILPNTVIAKQALPYSAPNRTLALQRHLYEPIAIIVFCKLMLLILIITLLYDRFVLKSDSSLFQTLRQSLRDSWQFRFSFLYVLFSLILSTAIGTNWGPEFRSFYSAWPLLFGLCLLPITVILRGRALLVATAVLCLFSLLRMSVRIHDMNSKFAPIYMPGNTVASIESINSVIAEIQQASHQKSLLFAGPDMGGILLYSNGVRVIDLGLLCDTVLARQGYGIVDSYVLQQRQPNLIEVHLFWTELTDVHHSLLFHSRYRPVYSHGKRIFLSRPLIASIDPGRLTEKPFTPTGYPQDADLPPLTTPFGEARYSKPDYILNKDFGTYLALK